MGGTNWQIDCHWYRQFPADMYRCSTSKTRCKTGYMTYFIIKYIINNLTWRCAEADSSDNNIVIICHNEWQVHILIHTRRHFL